MLSYWIAPGLPVVLSLDFVGMVIRKHTGFALEEIRSESRKRELVDARHLFCRLAAERTSKSPREIGKFISRDRVTVLHSIKQTREIPELDDMYNEIRNKLKTLRHE